MLGPTPTSLQIQQRKCLEDLLAETKKITEALGFMPRGAEYEEAKESFESATKNPRAPE